MSDPRRLLDGGGTDIERSLLEAGDTEAPDGVAKRRAAIALAIGVTSVWPTAAAASATATATAKTAKVGVPLIVKLLAVGTVGVGTLGVAKFVVSKPEPAPIAQTAPATNPVPAAEKSPVQSAPEAKIVEAPPVEEAKAEPVAEPERRAPSTSAAAPKSSADTSIASEILMIDQARKSVAAGSGASAIRALDDYRRQYPRGRFSEEATLIRIEALAQSGNRAGAKALAGRYRASHPNSPHLRRIESIVGSP
jgi:hypothetical protein